MKDKLVVHPFQIERPGQKRPFQVRLPFGTQCIGLTHVTSTALFRKRPVERPVENGNGGTPPRSGRLGNVVGVVGGLWLARPGSGDVFYATDVYRAGYRTQATIQSIPVPVQFTPDWLHYPESCDWYAPQMAECGPLLEGFYQDERLDGNPYTVTLYLKLNISPTS